MKINCYYQSRKGFYREWIVPNVFKGIIDKLKAKYPQHSFNFINSFEESKNKNIIHDKPGKKFGYNIMLLENADNGKYLVIWYYDKMTAINTDNHWDIENIVEVIGSIGGHSGDEYFDECPIKYTPSSFAPFGVAAEKSIETYYKDIKSRTHCTPWFKGECYNFRSIFANDNRFNVNHIVGPPKRHDYSSFIQECSNQQIGLSLNGLGEVCFRDMEYFGVGTVNIRTTLRCEFHDTLIPNYHYIEVPVKDIPRENYYKILLERFHTRYLEVYKDKDYLQYVADNARLWYIKNGTTQGNIDLNMKLINIDKLA